MNEIIEIKSEKGIQDYANNYILRNNIILSKNYDLPRAMNSLYLNLVQVKDKNGRTALETTSPVSIQEAVEQCINNELSVAKNQGYFIPYGDKLTFQKSYQGNRKLARDLANVEIYAQVVHDGDQFDYSIRVDGTMVVSHKPNIKNIDKPIICAYAVATDINTGRVVNSDVMSITEIKKSWSKSRAGGAVAKDFPVEMAKKTVISRLAKHFVNSSDDSQRVYLTDTNGETVQVRDSEDVYNFADYTIDTEEQIQAEAEVYNPAENEDVVTAQDLQVASFEDDTNELPDNAYEINYGEYKSNKDKYNFIKYNSATRKAIVTDKE